MATLFASDLHLDPSRPAITALFLAFLRGPARRADALYLLGDLFEAWVGDDDDSALAAEVAEGLRALSDAGVPVAFLRGNRDFLLGADYAARCGMRLLPDPCVVPLYGRPTLLAHGDTLCTDDTAYQAFRRQVRDPAWQAGFLAQPLAARQAFAAQARAASAKHQQGVMAAAGGEAIVDANPDAVLATFEHYGVGHMIHGHTHRPALHVHAGGGRTWLRAVLGDWYHQGSVLRVDADGMTLEALPLG